MFSNHHREKRFFFSSVNPPECVWGLTQLPIQCVPDFVLLGLRWPDREIDHSLSFNSKVRNERIFIFTPIIILRVLYSYKIIYTYIYIYIYILI